MAATADLWTAFDSTVARKPDAPAIVCGDRVVTFGQWAARSSEIAGALVRAGVRRGDRVLAWMDPSPELAAVATASWSIGGVVAVADPRETGDRLDRLRRLVEPRMVVYDAHREPPPGRSWGAAHAGQLGSTSGRSTPVRLATTDPASIVFTSGSTGGPKAVVQTHGSLLRGCRTVASVLGYRAGDRLLCGVPWSFDYGWGQLLSTAVLGLEQVLPGPQGVFGIAEAIERRRPTVVAAVPSLLHLLGDLLRPPSPLDVAAVRLVTTTGARVSRALVESTYAAFPAAGIALNYGLTESYRTTSTGPLSRVERPESVGRAIPGVDVVVVRDDGTPAGPGEGGEIVHRGDYLFAGYWGDAAGTRAALRRDPMAARGGPGQQRALFTGDLGALSECGELTISGRRDRLVKPHGWRVSPEEVERLLEGSGLVVQAAVSGVPDDVLGHELWAVVVPAEGGATDPVPEIRAWCRDAMPAALRPARYLVVRRLPQTGSGKVRHEEVAQMVARAAGRT